MRAAINLLTCFGAMALAGPAIGQTAMSIVECTWEGGAKETFRISPTSWALWNASTWQWQDRGCPHQPPIDHRLTSGSCQVTVTEAKYLWSQELRERSQEGLNTYNGDLLIDRQTGAARWIWSRYESYPGIRHEKEVGNQLLGNCAKAEDPSIQRRPAPKL